MDRIIQVKVRGHYMTKDNNKAGVKGEVNATHLHIEFDPSWEGLAKNVIFYDAHGGNPTKIVLTADNIIRSNDIPSEGMYVTHDVPIPGEAMTEHGWAEFIVEGVKDGVVAKSLADKLYVHDAPNTDGAGNAVEPTPSDLAQLQLQLEGILDKLMDAIEVGEMLDGVLTLDELVKLAQSYAVGGSGARPGENTDNAKYYYELCRQIANGNTGTPDSGGDSLPDSGGSSGGASGVVGVTEYIVSCYINSDNELIFVTNTGNELNAGKLPEGSGDSDFVLPSATSVSAVKTDNSITVTATYDNNTQSVSVIELDGNGDPVTVTKDGKTCTLSWEGFE